ncbi:flagellar protein FlaG [Endozoicomonas sp. G2_1]|uniref:flagellar protein FlaG n=1 Tax=Endozoicomonas sp. G2_1 TaxID=2821091 RepID=UPI001ADB5B19|nr:flagellar protein FlaG [Endozoicomonas sp. G2_1]MBO9489065.1 flagellar protein FlaG [Endozoicomonas sp. G2_1]
MESNINGIRPIFSDLTDRVGNSGSNELRPDTVSDELELSAESQPDFLGESRSLNNSQRELSEEEQAELLNSAIETVSSFIEPQIRNVNFTQDDSTGQRVIRVFDAESDELIKQFPSEEILELAERIRGLQEEIVDKTGILIDDKV